MRTGYMYASVYDYFINTCTVNTWSGVEYYDPRVCVSVCLSVCMCVCLSAHLSRKPHVQTSRNFLHYMLVVVAVVVVVVERTD